MRVLIVLAALVPLAAHATKPTPPPPVHTQSQAQAQGQVQGQKQAQSAKSDSASVSDSASSANNSITFEAAQRAYKNTPDVNLGGLFPSSSCMGVANAGVSGAGFGIGGGKSYVDTECDKRETARSFAALGYTAEALTILCSTEAAQVLPVCPGSPPAAPVCEPATCPDPEKVVDQRKQVAPEAGK